MARKGPDRRLDAGGPWSVGPGAFIILLAAIALLLPLVEWAPQGGLVGWLLFLAGGAELAFGARRGRDFVGRTAMVSGVLTMVSGLIFIARPFASFFPVANVVMAWLLVRGAFVLAMALRSGRTRAGTWLALSGGADLLLGAVLVIGLPVASLIVALFGPTREVVANFALIVAVSFLVTGLGQLAISLDRGGGR